MLKKKKDVSMLHGLVGLWRILSVFGLIAFAACSTCADVPSLQEVLASPRDLWGELARRQPDGPSFEFFDKLLPPLRYVNTAFRCYPILLSAPYATHKARLISDGSGINTPAGISTWQDEGLCPVEFQVGTPLSPFGKALANLTGPKYANGYLPIVQMDYRTGESVYREEAFASVESPFDPRITVVFVRFSVRAGQTGQVAAIVGRGRKMQAADGFVRDAQGQAWAGYDAAWRWNAETQQLQADLKPGRSAVLVVFSAGLKDAKPQPLHAAVYQKQRKQCVDYWNGRLQTAMRLVTPEPYVNDAYRSLLIGTLLLADGDALNYSALNIYAQTYPAETSDAVSALLLCGIADKGRLVAGLLQQPYYAAQGHFGIAFNLQLLALYYRLTGDADLVRHFRSLWEDQVRDVISHLDSATGLLPREPYCNDIGTKVFNLTSDANLWRGLRDMASVLAELQEHEAAERLQTAAESLRKSTLAAVNQSVYKDTASPFVPVALFGDEKPYAALTTSLEGSYWNLMAPYVLGSGIFGARSELSRWILDTIQNRGGLCMGLTRFHQHSGLYANENAVDDLYGLRYVLALLQRDEVELALTSFYGKLAQGMTRDTFLCGEASGLEPLDPQGRPLYLPPNSTGNGFFLWMLRCLLVQDWDEEDGAPKTLRLLFATPRRWLRNGALLKVEGAPTAFGPVSVTVHSRLAHGEVVAEVTAPPTAPKRMLLRFRLPDGWQAVSASVADRPLPLGDQNTLDISGLRERFVVRLAVRKASRLSLRKGE
jgi:hypothetical protein